MAFLDLHVPGDPLLIPNAWDVASARAMVGLGARAIATTSSGFAATLGRSDGEVSADEAVAHAHALAAAVDVPVSADLEDGFAAGLDGVADTYRRAADAGLAGASLEDWSGGRLLEAGAATERIAAARAAAPGLVLTGRAEGYLRGAPDLTEVVARLQAYAEAGADVLYAPGMTDLEEIRTLVAEVPRPVNVLLLAGMSVPALADAGVARISVGGALAALAHRTAAAATEAFLAGGSDWLVPRGA
jgi:2-methylisocitrate lyase-like PEP mutase family enzyme